MRARRVGSAIAVGACLVVASSVAAAPPHDAGPIFGFVTPTIIVPTAAATPSRTKDEPPLPAKAGRVTVTVTQMPPAPDQPVRDAVPPLPEKEELGAAPLAKAMIDNLLAAPTDPGGVGTTFSDAGLAALPPGGLQSGSVAPENAALLPPDQEGAIASGQPTMSPSVDSTGPQDTAVRVTIPAPVPGRDGQHHAFLVGGVIAAALAAIAVYGANKGWRARTRRSASPPRLRKPAAEHVLHQHSGAFADSATRSHLVTRIAVPAA
jgi:hypothetical protein